MRSVAVMFASLNFMSVSPPINFFVLVFPLSSGGVSPPSCSGSSVSGGCGLPVAFSIIPPRRSTVSCMCSTLTAPAVFTICAVLPAPQEVTRPLMATSNSSMLWFISAALSVTSSSRIMLHKLFSSAKHTSQISSVMRRSLRSSILSLNVSAFSMSATALSMSAWSSFNALPMAEKNLCRPLFAGACSGFWPVGCSSGFPPFLLYRATCACWFAPASTRLTSVTSRSFSFVFAT